METLAQVKACSPRETPPIQQCGLIHLKTKLEVRTEEDVGRHLRQSFQDLDNTSLQHLRRFVKPEFLPRQLRKPRPCNTANPNVYSERVDGSSYPSPSTPTSVDQGCNSSGKDGSNHAILSMLVSPTRTISGDTLAGCLNAFDQLLGYLEGPPIIWTTTVPLLPPNTAEQAEYWSQKYWPTVYKGSNPLGPHPSIVSRAEQDLRAKARHFMSLASQAGTQARTHGLGDAVGAVIVDGFAPDGGSLTIVAGDARWCRPARGLTGCEGSSNVMGHAVMRAIGMVARRRLHLAEGSHLKVMPLVGGEAIDPIVPGKMDPVTDTFLDQPLTPIENTFYQQGSISRDGYLCVGLDIYTTHEPCVMCSMAVLHSRFRGIVFGQRMMQTGGLTAEVAHQSPRTHSSDRELHGLGYGMFWRDELNWKLSAWQWTDQGQSSIPEVHPSTHA